MIAFRLCSDVRNGLSCLCRTRGLEIDYMSRITLFSFLILCLSTPAQTWAESSSVPENRTETETISDVAYVGSLVVGGAFGFGLGHTIQKRWKQTGWIFTLVDVVVYGALTYGVLKSMGDPSWDHSTYGGVTVGALVLSKGLQVYDLWGGPPQSKTANHPSQVRNTHWRPVISYGPDGQQIVLGVSFNH